MKIKFRQTGGFAGLTRVAELDTSQLPGEEAAQLQHLMEQSDFFEIPEPTAPTQPDEEQYCLEVEASGRSRLLVMGRSQLPARLKLLVDYTNQRATYLKRQ